MDCRLPESRVGYFTQLYELNLRWSIMPGLVYLYMPELSRRLGWDDEQKLWFAFLNGMTQNPITSMVMMERLPEVPQAGQGTLLRFAAWFDESWENLQFDTDRRYQKKDTVQAIECYAALARAAGSQEQLWTGDYQSLWKRANTLPAFGRLASFSYLEYVHIMGHGADCDDLMFSDKSGSRSHRNGMLLLCGMDDRVWDKRAGNGFDGSYGPGYKKMCETLAWGADALLERFRENHPGLEHASRFTLESNLCTFKNHFYGRRYPGVYADMAWERIAWADAHGWEGHTQVFKDMRAELLPLWLRRECELDSRTTRERAALFVATGRPYRAEFFLDDQPPAPPEALPGARVLVEEVGA